MPIETFITVKNTMFGQSEKRDHQADPLELTVQIPQQDSVRDKDSKMMTNKIMSSDTDMLNSQRKEPRKRVKVRTRISEFADYTSTHAIGHIKRVEHPLHKFFWICCLLTAMSYFGYQVVSLVQTYIAKDYTVLIDIKFDRQLQFPAVTVCNLNPLRFAFPKFFFLA